MNDYMGFNHSRYHTLIVCTLFVGGECGGDVRKKNLIDVQNKFRRDEGGGYQIQKAISAVGRGKSGKVRRCAVWVGVIFAALYAPKNPLVPSLSSFVSAPGHCWLLLLIGAAAVP